MLEYAIRKSDGKHIYIGSCANMSALRFEDRDKVTLPIIYTIWMTIWEEKEYKKVKLNAFMNVA